MVIVGYDDAKSAYRIQNSWGTDWGDQGYSWWDYADLEARAGLHAFVPDLLPAGMTVDPNPTMATLTVDITGAVQFTYGTLTGVAIRIDGSGPFHLTNVTVTALSTQDDFDEELIYGDITLPLTAAVAAGTYEASISGDVAGTAFTKGIMFTIGAPVVLQ